MKKLESGGKIVQHIERGAAVEVNKATGDAKSISKRDVEASHSSKDIGSDVIGSLYDRVKFERKAAKKLVSKKASAKAYNRTSGLSEIPKLRFTAEERSDPALKRSIRKADKAVKKYDAARSKLPKKKRLAIERFRSDKAGGKMKTHLVFKESVKKSSGKLKHALNRPAREFKEIAHKAAKESDNVGLESVDFAERTVSGAVRKVGDGYRRLVVHRQRAALRLEKKVIKSNSRALYEKSLRNNPQLKNAGPLKKATQKRKIKKEYARAFRQKKLSGTVKKAKSVKRSAKQVKDGIKNVIKFIVNNKKIIVIIIVAILFLSLMITTFSSCMSLFTGGFNSVVLTSYTAEDEDILGADADYEAKETELAARIARIESENPGYDEYHYYLDEIGHDPYALASYLTAKFNMYTRAQVQGELSALFEQQYELTLNPVVEIRTRTETQTHTVINIDPVTQVQTTEDIEIEVEVQYEYHILEITLKNKGIQFLAQSNLTPEELQMYHVYMETLGNKPELFDGHPSASRREYMNYDVPPDALDDERFAAMLREAEKYLGYPYVWGGSSPATSFDCSGYVSWVINHSGWSVGRLGAKALYGICTPVSPSDAKPGDLVFFINTYAAPDPNAPTHVGIYVGNGMMIHCGNPISYASLSTAYWTKHFYSFGRLP